MMVAAFKIVQWVLLAIALISAGPGYGDGIAQSSTALEERFDRLIKKAEEKGKIWVVINVRIEPGWEPDATLEKKGQGLAADQRARLREKQVSVLRAIQVDPADPKVRLYEVGGISVQVDARQLQVLRKHPDVSFIDEPRKLQLTLDRDHLGVQAAGH